MYELGQLRYRGKRLHLLCGQYGNGRVALVLALRSGEWFARVSINVVDRELAWYEFVVDHDLDLELLEELLAGPWLAPTGRGIAYGYTGGPVLRLSLESLANLEAALSAPTDGP